MSIKFVSSDLQEFSIDKAVIERSTLLKNLVDNFGESSDSPIPLPRVPGKILDKVLQFCIHHKDDPPPPAEEDRDAFDNARRRTDDIDEWDAFIKVDNEQLFGIILAANYLDIKPLLDLGCKTVANMIKGKPVEELREMFAIQNNFTPEEEEQIRKENEWCEDS